MITLVNSNPDHPEREQDWAVCTSVLRFWWWYMNTESDRFQKCPPYVSVCMWDTWLDSLLV